MKQQHHRIQAATAIAIILHAVGLVGILAYNSDFIINCTPYNLLVCFALITWTQKDKPIAFWLFLLAVFAAGYVVEAIGVNTGKIFGAYKYGTVLGPKILATPIMIGINWCIVMYCCGISAYSLLMHLQGGGYKQNLQISKSVKVLSLLVDGATLATFYDWIMEPVAIQLGFWEWTGDMGVIPWYNYFCWFIISMIMLGIFHIAPFRKRNKFAINLLLVQLLFFLILRIYLNN
ncbi:MAG TPA: carotenoid biosynthesis protein [Ferruginibacter sp.]|nr:carotenoid biosynthesis protein [Ferruginibacter sp.]HMP19441.1 carotenoid biosynthesis protein [Ferruginibacter sp.]